MNAPDFVQSSMVKEDNKFDLPLRPSKFDDFVGQEELIERLSVVIEAAMERGEPLHHILFAGPPGLGKTTLAHLVAKKTGGNLVVTSGPVLERAGDLAGILTSLKEGDFLFIDEIHRLNKVVEEYLYPALEDFTLDLVIDSGPAARSVQVKLNRFTLIGATTRVGLLSAPMRSRFSSLFRLNHYTSDHLAKIVRRSAQVLDIQSIEDDACALIAERARGTPRVANNLLRFVRDYAQVRAARGQIGQKLAQAALDMLAVDALGLEEVDLKLLKILVHHYGGGPVGLNTLAIALGEEADTIEEVLEPYLIMKGFIKRTPRGRLATELAVNHVKRS